MTNPAGSEQDKIYYGIDDKPEFSKNLFYSFQWMFFSLANVIVVPAVLGISLGLTELEIAQLAQRTFLVSGLACLLQIYIGHRLPVLEGAGGMWLGLFISMAGIASATGKSLTILRTDLEFGLLMAGMVLILMGIFRLADKLMVLFTPAVNGTVMVLLVLQLSGPFMKGAMGVGTQGEGINWKAAAISLVIIIFTAVFSTRATGFWRTISILLGAAGGWILAGIMGMAPKPVAVTGVFSVPEVFAWGTPTVDSGVIATSVVVGVLLISNLSAGVSSVGRLTGAKVTSDTYNKGCIATGLADIFAGLGSTIGFVPFVGSAGFLRVTGVASKYPLIGYAVLMIIMGLVPKIGMFLAAIPPFVGYAVLLCIFAQLLCHGFLNYFQVCSSSREMYIIGLSVIFGIGIMFFSGSDLDGLPVFLKYLLGNGFVLGTLVCIILEQLVLPAGRQKAVAK
ncbi:MAG: xanthine permease [Firmicutes bacterium HGW-Firmicutes-14]|nr:MAG: xanthine permease [Firmicutes bacterium HGW-Firmicutes-14]